MLINYQNGKILIFSQLLPHVTFQKYSTWWHLAVFQTVKTHAQPFFYTQQYFQVHPKFKSTSSYYSTDNCMLTWGKLGVACYFWMALYIFKLTLHNLTLSHDITQDEHISWQTFLLFPWNEAASILFSKLFQHQVLFTYLLLKLIEWLLQVFYCGIPIFDRPLWQG